MKNFSLVLCAVTILAAAGCSRSDKPETSVKPQSTPDVERLKSDSERLQQATNNAAEERKREEASQATGPGPKADLSPHTVPPQSPNPTP
jgi:hypothetical protein